MFALALISAACSKAPTKDTSPSNKAEPIAQAAVADDVLAFLPADSEFVVGVDWKAARASALYRRFEPEIIDSLGSKLPRMREECGFDPLVSIERAAVGGKLVRSDNFEGVIVIRGVSGPKTLECIAKASEGEGAIKNENGVLTVDRGSDKMVATVVASTTLVVQIGSAANAATIDGLIRAGAPLRSAATFMALFERREPGASVWGMIRGNSSLLETAAQAGVKPKSVDGTLVLTDRFVGAMRVTFGSAADADAMKKQLDQIMPMVQGRFEKVDVRADGAVLRADVIATDEQVKTVLGMLGGMF